MTKRRSAAITLTVLGLVGVALAGCGALRGSFSDQATQPATVTGVRLVGTSGSITIRREPNRSDVGITRQVHYLGDRPSARTDRLDGQTLVLTSNCGTSCDVDYTVAVPNEIDVDGSVTSGDLNLTGLAKVSVSADSGSITLGDIAGDVNASANSGDVTGTDLRGRANVRSSSGTVKLTNVGGSVNVQADSGDVRLTRVAGDIKVRVSSGSVIGTGLGGTGVDVQSDSGDIKLTLTAAQSVTAHASSGSVSLTVPAGQSYLVQAHTDSGSAHVTVPTDPASRYTLKLDADSGDVNARTG